MFSYFLKKILRFFLSDRLNDLSIYINDLIILISLRSSIATNQLIKKYPRGLKIEEYKIIICNFQIQFLFRKVNFYLYIIFIF